MNNHQQGFYTIEVLIAAALSTVILLSIFSSYLLMKDQYLKQSSLIEEQENICSLYLILKKLIDESTDIKTYSSQDTSSSLHILSEVLQITSKNNIYKIYLRETSRNKLRSIYLKKDELNAQELISDVLGFSVKLYDDAKKNLLVRVTLNSREIPMYFEVKENVL